MKPTLNPLTALLPAPLTVLHAVGGQWFGLGAGDPADVAIRGPRVLVDHCSSHGLGGCFVATLNRDAMSKVVLNFACGGAGSIQPHMHWSTGLRIDSCTIPEGRIDLINRHSSGSGHGRKIRH